MDIRILLLLQEFRNGGGAFLAEFAAKMTFLGELNSVMVIMAVMYWCVSRDYGVSSPASVFTHAATTAAHVSVAELASSSSSSGGGGGGGFSGGGGGGFGGGGGGGAF